MFAWAACAVALGLPSHALLLGAGGIAALGLVAVGVLRPRAPGATRVVALAAGLACGLCAGLILHRAYLADPVLTSAAANREDIWIAGTVIDPPRQLPHREEEPRGRQVFEVKVQSFTRASVSFQTTAHVLVLAPEGETAVEWGDRVTVSGKLSSSATSDRFAALLHGREPPTISTERASWLRASDQVRRGLVTATSGLPFDAAGLVPALVLGETSGLTSELTEAMRAAGLTHLTAVSGTNVTYVLLGAAWCMRLLGLPRRWRPAIGLVVVMGFVVLARPEPSVLRAAAMGSIGLIGLTASRRAHAAPALAGATLMLLFADPWLARSYGFVLSVLATGGLLIFARPWGEWLASHLPGRARPIAFAFTVPLAAQVMCLPVLVLLQGAISLASVPANVLAGPLVAPVTLAGMVASVLAVISVRLAAFAAWCAALPATGIAVIAHTAAQLPASTIPVPGGTYGVVVVAGMTVLILMSGPLVRRLGHRVGARGVQAALVAITAVWVALAIPLPGRQAPSSWLMASCDVGQGDALLLSTGQAHHAIVIDAGRQPRAADQCLRALEITHLDAVFLTHYDADHVDALSAVLEGREVGEVITASAVDAGGKPRAVRKALGGREPTLWRRGDSASWGWATLTAVHPAGRTPGSNANTSSLVLDAHVADTRILLLADADTDATATVLRRLEPTLASDPVRVVKVSHHGSADYVDGLYQRLGADLAVISVGAGNDYGHPTAKTLQELQTSGSAVWRTDERGTILVLAEGDRGERLAVTSIDQ